MLQYVIVKLRIRKAGPCSVSPHEGRGHTIDGDVEGRPFQCQAACQVIGRSDIKQDFERNLEMFARAESPRLPTPS